MPQRDHSNVVDERPSSSEKALNRVIRNVIVEVTASAEELAAVEGVFARAGFRVKGEAGLPPSGGPPVPVDWMLQVTLAVPIAAFFAAFASEAGKDAYGAVKAWLKDLQATRGTSGRVILWDAEDTTLAFGDGPIPDEALDALGSTDWGSLKGRYIAWDGERGEWRNVG
jgi:hypothetical protein